MAELIAQLWGVDEASTNATDIDSEDLANWKHQGSIWINTTPEGANVPIGC
jgi:hypothetical protein